MGHKSPLSNRRPRPRAGFLVGGCQGDDCHLVLRTSVLIGKKAGQARAQQRLSMWPGYAYTLSYTLRDTQDAKRRQATHLTPSLSP